MKSLTRHLIGVISSLLLLAGLSRAAEKFDPLTRQIGHQPLVSAESLSPATNTTFPCERALENAPLTLNHNS